ncbi:Rho GTPase activation protein [Wallemia mellicola]|nr:Rho GTPase activation protein [Wallemia mellicola]
MAHALDEFSYKQFIPEYEISNLKLKVNQRITRPFIPMMSKLRRSSAKIGSTGLGWKNISIKLSSTGVLFLYTEENALINSVPLTNLRMTDIRPVDNSVYSVPNMIVIHTHSLSPTLLIGQNSSGHSSSSYSTLGLLNNLRPTSPKSSQRLSPSVNQFSNANTDEPIFIAFPSRRHMVAYLTLLRSCTKADVYHTSKNPHTGYFRISRQLSINVMELRPPQKDLLSLNQSGNPDDTSNGTLNSHNVNSINSLSSTSSSGLSPSLQRRSSTHFTESCDTYEWYCEIWDPTGLAFKTSIKVGQHPFWKEDCLLLDLPNLNSVTIKIFRSLSSHTLSKGQSTLFGTVFIPLKAYPRLSEVEKWFNVIGVNDTTLETSIRGELSLSLRVDEDVILPQSRYSELFDIIRGQNRVKVIHDLSSIYPSLEHLADTLISIYSVDSELLVSVINDLAYKEIWSSRADENTIFRPNTILTKLMDRYMNFMSRLTGWLEDSLGEPIREMIEKKVECELDTDRKRGPADKDELLYWADLVLNSIIESRVGCPIELRRIFHNIRKQCHARWGKAQLVNSFIFLRLFVPAIINPNLFGLTNIAPTPPVSRTLTLIAKIIQALANNKEELGDKEHFMGVVSPFLQDRNRRFAFIDYVAYVGNEDSAASYETSEEISINELAKSVERTSDERFSNYKHDIYRESLPNSFNGIDYSRGLASFTNDLTNLYNKLQMNDLQNRDHHIKRKSLDHTTLELFDASLEIQDEARILWETRQKHKRKANSAYEASKANKSEWLSDQQDGRTMRKASLSSSGTATSGMDAQSRNSSSHRRRGFTITGLSAAGNNNNSNSNNTQTNNNLTPNHQKFMTLSRGASDYYARQFEVERRASSPNTQETFKDVRATLSKYNISNDVVPENSSPHNHQIPVNSFYESRSKSRASVRNSIVKGDQGQGHSKDDNYVDNRKKSSFFKWTK